MEDKPQLTTIAIELRKDHSFRIQTRFRHPASKTLK
jgi:hypothetical protein